MSQESASTYMNCYNLTVKQFVRGSNFSCSFFFKHVVRCIYIALSEAVFT